MSAPKYIERKSFTVPAVADTYAPERITFGAPSADVPATGLLGVTALLESAPADAVVELWLPRIGAAVPAADADYFLFKVLAATGETVALASYPGARILVKSGGTVGTAVVSASAD